MYAFRNVLLETVCGKVCSDIKLIVATPLIRIYTHIFYYARTVTSAGYFKTLFGF